MKNVTELFKSLMVTNSKKAWEIVNTLLPDFPKYADCDLHLADDLLRNRNPQLNAVALPLIEAALGVTETPEVTEEAIPATA